MVKIPIALHGRLDDERPYFGLDVLLQLQTLLLQASKRFFLVLQLLGAVRRLGPQPLQQLFLLLHLGRRVGGVTGLVVLQHDGQLLLKPRGGDQQPPHGLGVRRLQRPVGRAGGDQRAIDAFLGPGEHQGHPGDRKRPAESLDSVVQQLIQLSRFHLSSLGVCFFQ